MANPDGLQPGSPRYHGHMGAGLVAILSWIGYPKSRVGIIHEVKLIKSWRFPARHGGTPSHHPFRTMGSSLVNHLEFRVPPISGKPKVKPFQVPVVFSNHSHHSKPYTQGHTKKLEVSI